MRCRGRSQLLPNICQGCKMWKRTTSPGSVKIGAIGNSNQKFPGVIPQMGNVCSRSVCRSTECADSNILQLETRSNSSSNRCISTAMDRGTGVRVSPICIDRAKVMKDQAVLVLVTPIIIIIFIFKKLLQ